MKYDGMINPLPISVDIGYYTNLQQGTQVFCSTSRGARSALGGHREIGC